MTKVMLTFIKDRRTDQCAWGGLTETQQCNLHYKCKDKATIFNNYFTYIFTKKYESNIPPFDDYGVTALLSNLEVQKANGPDEIPALII